MICVLNVTISLSQGGHILHELLYHPNKRWTRIAVRQNLFDYRLAMFLVLLVQLNQCEALSLHCNSDSLSRLIISSSHLIGRVVKLHVPSLVDRIELLKAPLSHDPSKQPQPRLYL